MCMARASRSAVTPVTQPARSARREATRARLLRAASDAFAERGLHGASVEDICERAGFTRGAFYSNFADKDDLVLALFEQHARRLRSRAEELAARQDLTPEEILTGVIDVLVGSPREQARWHLLQAEFTLHAIRDPAARRAFVRQQDQVRDMLASVVERVAQRHGLRLSVSPGEFVRLAQAVSSGGTAQHLLQPRVVHRGALEREFLPLVLRAVSAPA